MEIDAWRGAREKSMHVPCFSSVVPLTDDISRALISSSLVGELGTVWWQWQWTERGRRRFEPSPFIYAPGRKIERERERRYGPEPWSVRVGDR